MLTRTLPFLVVAIMLQLSCNPPCNFVKDIRVTPTFRQGGEHILVTANPPEFLYDKQLFLNQSETPLEFVEWREGIGLVVRLPDILEPGQSSLKIENEDCLEEVLVDFKTIESGTTTDFIAPSPPDIIFPSIPTAFPPSIQDAWLSVDDPDYCLWFKFQRVVAADRSIIETNVLCENSAELSTCKNAAKIYHGNRVSGIIDTLANRVYIAIHRPPEKGGLEEYDGQFVNKADTPYKNQTSFEFSCGETSISIPANDNMILLTSRRTGQQTVIAQTVLPPDTESNCVPTE